ncbi:MAG: hypothetical protein LLF96_09890 [Eubacteriales bacterium]|nr:hypothetical protein [Eubacteriales bacterium]
MASQTLGNVLVIYRGAYNPAATYQNGHVTAYGGDTYLCVSRTEIMGIPPVVNGAVQTAYWVLSADNSTARAAAASANTAATNANAARLAFAAIPVNAANGYTQLDSNAKVPEALLPDRLTGAPPWGTGRNLKDVFGTAAALHTAVAAGDFSKIRIGDYWPITLTGTYHDYAENADKTLSAAVLNMEVSGINHYWRHGDIALTANHLLFCPRDCLPNTSQFRSDNVTWYAPDAGNPWLGSHLYQTLNAADGLLPLIAATDIGIYLYAGPNGMGMRTTLANVTPGTETTTGWAARDRGKLFLPTEREVWGSAVHQANGLHGVLAIQWPLFAGGLKHISKGLGNGGSRAIWWCATATTSIAFACVHSGVYPNAYNAAGAYAVAPCFLVV